MTDEPLTDSELDAIERRCAAASPAPWTAFTGPGIGGPDFIRVSDDDGELDMYVERDGAPAAREELDFIAAARQDVPRLVAEIRRLRAPGAAR
jgi:hypothetical protein